MSRRLLTRRELLIAGGALLAGCDTSRPHAGLLGALDRFNARGERLIQAPERRAPRPAPSASTPLDAFPQYKIGADFPEPPAGYALEIAGMVSRPLRLTVDELRKLERTELRVQHHCVEGWSAVATWHGVRLSTLAELAQVDRAAQFVELVSFEATPDDSGATYTSSWDVESALHPQTLIAYGMDGVALGRAHGGPVRAYSALKLGYKMVKWLAAVRFLPQATGGYWEDQGYEWFAGV